MTKSYKLFIETTTDNIYVKVPECATSGMAESILYEVGRQMVPLSTADRCIIWKNRAIDGTSMKFGIQLGHALRKIFGYRAIADLSHNKNGSQKLTLKILFVVCIQVCIKSQHLMEGQQGVKRFKGSCDSAYNRDKEEYLYI